MNRSEMKKLLLSARKAEETKRKHTNKLLCCLENTVGVFLDEIPNNSVENANNLKEAILCHINCGEGNLEELLDDIQNALKERGNENE